MKTVATAEGPVRLIRISSPLELATFASRPELPSFLPEALARDQPQEHWILLDQDNTIAARASLWWEKTPAHFDHRVGLIGHYAAATSPVAHVLLNHACAQLHENRCTLAIAPIDGSTWRGYRFVIESSDEPPFLLEPHHPPEWPAQLLTHGFNVVAHYYSALNENLAYEDPAMTRAESRLAEVGIHLRALDPRDLEEELKRIHAVTARSFEQNFLYTPVSEMDFIQQYAPLLPRLEPDMILLAEFRGQCVGYVFLVPDFLQASRGIPITTAILKTVAVLPEHAHAGLGSWLVAKGQIAARQLGYKRVVHALMHEDNSSRKISRRYARLIRRYGLFARPLP